MKPALRRVGLGLLLLGLTACSSQPARRQGGWQGARRGGHDNLLLSQDRRYSHSRDSVPGGPPPDPSKVPEPVPRAEPHSLYGNKSPYTVLGHTYTVLPSAHGYVERGTASYYGSKFDHYKTSNLEDYDMYAYTAAHKTLPLPSYVRVTNLDNGKSVVVRVNDRGPFKDGRLIDLSYIAAVKIGIWPSGTGRVEVRALDPLPAGASPPPALTPAVAPALPPRPLSAPAPVASGPGTVVVSHSAIPVAAPAASARPPAPPLAAGGLFLQVGAFADQSNAERTAARIRAAHVGIVQVLPGRSAGRLVQRVRIGPLPDQATVESVTRRIVLLGLPRPQPAVN